MNTTAASPRCDQSRDSTLFASRVSTQHARSKHPTSSLSTAERAVDGSADGSRRRPANGTLRVVTRPTQTQFSITEADQ